MEQGRAVWGVPRAWSPLMRRRFSIWGESCGRLWGGLVGEVTQVERVLWCLFATLWLPGPSWLAQASCTCQPKALPGTCPWQEVRVLPPTCSPAQPLYWFSSLPWPLFQDNPVPEPPTRVSTSCFLMPR